MISLKQQHELTHRILFCEPNPASQHDISRYFGPYRFPGTTSIGYRRTHPEIFQDTLDSRLEPYNKWLKRSVAKTACAVMDAKAGRHRRNTIEDPAIERIVDKVAEFLQFTTADGVRLADAIPQQLYEDTFVRIISYIRHPDDRLHEPHLYREFNALCHRIGLALLDVLERGGTFLSRGSDITQLIHVSVLSGHIGINLKSSASAASFLLNRDLVPLPKEWIETPAAVKNTTASDLSTVADRVLEIAGSPEGQFGLESLNDYYVEVVDTDVPTLLVFFCDDYLESIIDLKRFEVMLIRNPNLQVLFIPRAGRYGNDLAYQDVQTIFQELAFKGLRELKRTGRFHLSVHGPKAGCIDPRDVNRGLIHEIDSLGKDRKIIFETKGCRNFEMLRGRLTIPWYSSFNCNRALSIRTVQVDGPPVFLRIPPGLNAYDGFTRPRIGHSPSYPNVGVRFARMTTRDLYTTLDAPFYRDALKRIGDEYHLNTTLMDQCRIRQLTIAEIPNMSKGRRNVRAHRLHGNLDYVQRMVSHKNVLSRLTEEPGAS
ncbi:MAG: hypothetical protein PVF53_22160 [Desulfobacterales bacterium]|jgi:hypothetical protein